MLNIFVMQFSTFSIIFSFIFNIQLNINNIEGYAIPLIEIIQCLINFFLIRKLLLMRKKLRFLPNFKHLTKNLYYYDCKVRVDFIFIKLIQGFF